VIALGAQFLHVDEGEYLNAPTAGSLQGRLADGLDGHYDLQTARRLFQQHGRLAIVLHHHDGHVRLANDEGTGIGTQGVVQWDHHQGERVAALLVQDPLRSVLGVNSNQLFGPGSQRQHSGPEVLGAQQGLVIVDPLLKIWSYFSLKCILKVKLSIVLLNKSL